MSPSVILALLAAALPHDAGPAPQDEPVSLLEPVELRALVVRPADADVLGTPALLAAAIQRAAGIGFDAIVPVAWSAGRALFASPALAQLAGGEALAFPGRDVLAEIVFEAHRAGLEVLPAIDGSFAGAPGLPQVKDGGRPLTTTPEARAFARAFAHELARQADLDGLVLLDGLPAIARHDANPALLRSVGAEVTAWRAELRALDPALVVVWAALDPKFVGPAELGLLDAVDLAVLREPPPDAEAPLAAWIAAKPRRAALWVDLTPEVSAESLLGLLATARKPPFAGEVLGPWSALAGEENALVDALTQGIEAPYYARATLPWRGEVVWRPRAEPSPAEIVSGSWTDVEDAAELELKELPPGEDGRVAWSVKPEVRGRNELWVHVPHVAGATGKLVFTLTNDPQRVSRLEVDRGAIGPSGWIPLGARLLNRPGRTEVVRLDWTPTAAGPALRAGPLVALPRRRPEGR